MDIKQQTQNVANQGRYGDSMLLHVNPAEVKGLASALPLTVNPQTGQPEAFLPFLAPLLGSTLFSTLAGTGALGATLAANSALASGIGAGLATYAQTGGSGSKALLSGLTSGFGSAAMNKAALAADPTIAQTATQQALSDPNLVQAVGGSGQLPGTVLNQAGEQAVAEATTGMGNFGNLKTMFTSPQGFDFDQGAMALAGAAGSPMGMAAGTAAGMRGIMESQEAFARQIGESEEAYRRRREAMYRNTPEPTLYSGGGAIRGFNGEDDSDTTNDLPQIFAPARQTYDVNPNFMAGFNPETMYFNPATIAAPASSLSANSAPPVLEDTYTGTKGGYGGDPLVISPEGRQASIDPFTAYTGEAPAGLVPYSTTQPAPYIDITGEDLGLPDGGGEYVFDNIQTLDEQEGGDDFEFDIEDYLNGLDLSDINIMGQNYDFTNYDFDKLLNDYNTSNEVFTQADTDINFTNNDNLLDLDNLLQIQDENIIDYTDSYDTTLDDLLNLQNDLNMNMGVDSFVENEGTQTSNVALDDLLALENSINMNTGVDSFTTTDNTLNNTLDLTAFDPLNAIDTTSNLGVTDTVNTDILTAFNPLDAIDTTSNLGVTDTLNTDVLNALNTLNETNTIDNYGMTNNLNVFDSLNTFGLTEDQLNTPKMDRLTMAKGGQLPNKGLEALSKTEKGREAVEAMGYQEGGMTMMNDPLTQEVTMFILGETDNEQALNNFITKYGSDAFMQLRETVLQSIVPNAQTEGLIRGNGEGGMDDDLRGMIGDKERIAVSQDEFIVPADVVSMLGDGSSDAGSKELYDMMDRVRKEKTGTTKQAPRLANAGGLLPA